jgi:hypothetical protein
MSEIGRISEPTLLQPNQWAIVWSEDGDFEFLVPDTVKDEDPMPHQMVAMMAAFFRVSEDEEFFCELLHWFEVQQGNACSKD